MLLLAPRVEELGMTTSRHDRVRRVSTVRVATLFAAASLAGFPALAQENEPVISSASRYGQSLYEAPASVTVISRDEIRRFGYRTLAQVLSAAGGMFTSYDRNYDYLTVRGLAKPGDFNTRVLVLLDGRRLNQPVDDSALLGTEGLVDVEALDRVEIIRGPGSTLYGTNAFYAVVNLVTRTGASARGVEAQLSGGSFESGQASLAGGTRTAGGLDVFAIASGYKSRGPDLYYPEFDAPETNGGRAVGLDGDEFGRGLVRVMKGDFTVEGFYSTRRKEIPTASYDTIFGDSRERTRDGGGMFSAGYEHAFADLSRVWATASYQSGFYDGDYPYEDGLLSDYISSRWLTLEGQYQRFVGGRHRISVGGELRRNLRLEQGVTDALAFRQTSWVAAGFLQGELHLSERVTLDVGGRYDHYDTFGGSFSPRVVLVAEPTTGTWVKAMYGRAFRAPGAYELFYEDGSVTQKPALDLEPERLETFELALERRLRAGLRGSLAVYHTKVRNLIGLVADPADDLLVYANGDTARSTGVEAGVEGQITSSLFTRASYAYQQAEEGPEDLRPVNSPRHVGHVAMSLSLLDGRLVPGLEVHYLGPRTTLAGAEVDSYTLASLVLQARPKPGSRLEVLAKVGDLFDTAYSDPGGEEHRQDVLARDGRTAWLSVRFRF
jgi:outer membrane receptor for ferrienterochelin and colicins